jgi:hypothetical protein
VLLTILLDWCVPRRALRWGDVLGYHDTLTLPWPPQYSTAWVQGRLLAWPATHDEAKALALRALARR